MRPASITITLPLEQRKQIRLIAAEADMNLTQYIRLMIQDEIKQATGHPDGKLYPTHKQP